MLVKGNMQGASKIKKLANSPPISKYAFFENFKKISLALNKAELATSNKYLHFKYLSSDYNSSGKEFYRVYKDWLRTDQEKYYNF